LEFQGNGSHHLVVKTLFLLKSSLDEESSMILKISLQISTSSVSILAL
jgi:hypothetical protein